VGAGAGFGAGGGGLWRGVNHARLESFWPCADTRTSTLTWYPGVALPIWYQKVYMPVASARADFVQSPVWKCATTLICAPGAVKTEMPILLPSRGCLPVTDTVDVSWVLVGVAVGVAVAEVEVDAAVTAGRCPDVQPTAPSTSASAVSPPMRCLVISSPRGPVAA
jgi:hypothetical protein